MFITRARISRRSVLRGIGATVALPLLDSMIPAFATAATTRGPRRLGVVYGPNGMTMSRWTPATTGATFELSPTLAPLQPFRERMVVLSGLSNVIADAYPGEGGGDHGRAQAAFLTGAHAKKSEGADIRAGMSMDQIVARELGRDTQLGSFELALEAGEMAGGCEVGLACAYFGTIVWRDEVTPLPMENNPRAAFERLFGATDSTDLRARTARLQMNRSVLDSVTEDLAGLRRRIGAGDQIKLDQYLGAVRDIERRIRNAEAQGMKELPELGQPAGVPASFEEYARMMYDLLFLAFQSDMTRVGTFLVGRELSARSYPEAGVPESHHGISHHRNLPDLLEKVAKINAFHMKFFAEFLKKMQSAEDGDGSLLDHSIFLYGSGISNSDIHDHHELPLLLVGGGDGQLKGGRHIRYPRDTPMANLHMTLLEKMGVPVEKLGDSTGKLDLLADL